VVVIGLFGTTTTAAASVIVVVGVDTEGEIVVAV